MFCTETPPCNNYVIYLQTMDFQYYVFAPSGQLAAFFAAMEHADARKKWPFRWAHLLTPTLGMSV